MIRYPHVDEGSRRSQAVAWSAAGADAIGISRSRPQRGRAPRGDSR